jgi:hypothetical protein
MPVSIEKIRQMEFELEQARAQFLQEDGRRYQIIMREISPEEKQRILDNLGDRQERILFGLEKAATGAERPGKSGGDLECPICGKSGLTPRGLALHKARKHKNEAGEEGETQEMFAPAGSRRSARE